MLGLAQVDGDPVAVVDLHALLDREGDPGGGHQLTVLVRRADGGARLGLAVDEVFGVMPVAGATPPEDDDPPWVSVRGRMDDRPVVVLDVERLFAEEQAG